jgi:hypothetical protein
MLNAGIFTLGDISISTETLNDYLGEWCTDISGSRAVTAEVRLAGATTGTSVTAYLQTSLDGTSAIDVAAVAFAGHTDQAAVLNLSGLTPTAQTTATDGELPSGQVVDGILGDRFRMKVRVVGTYSPGSTITGRLCVR